MNESSQSQKVTYCKISFIKYSCNGKLVQMENRSVVVRGGEGTGGREL